MRASGERGPPAFDLRSRLGIDPDLIGLLIFVLVVPFVIGSASKIFADGDVSWHVAAGKWMIAHRQVPFADPFSFSAAGKPWVAHEWLSEVIMGAAYNVAGVTGLSVLVIAALSALMLVLWLELGRWLDPVRTGAVLAAVAVTLIPFLVARPMVLTWPLLAFWTVRLMHAREEKRAPPLWLALVMLLWVNLHASFVVGLALIGPFAVEALVEETDKPKALIGWGMFGLLCAAACLVNPNTVTGFLAPIVALRSSTINLVQEFRPTDMSLTPGFEYSLLLLLAMSLGTGAKVRPLRLLLLLGMLHLAFQHMRHQVLFMIIGALVLAQPIGAAGERRIDNHGKRLRDPRPLAAAALGFVLLVVVRLAQPLAIPDSNINPVSALAAIPPQLRDQPVLNSYSFGGPLILRGIKPYIDGRTDVYGDPFVVKYKKMLDGDAGEVARAQKRWNFRWALISTEDQRLLSILDHSPEWRRIRADRYAVTFVHR